MPHRAIIGQTGSGKTYAAQQSALALATAGAGVLVLHKEGEIWPLPRSPLVWQTADPERFLDMFDRSRSCACFMELADADVDKFDARFHRCFTRGRHLGHRCFYVSQRAAQVHPNIRDNCESLLLFACNAKAAGTWAADFNDPVLGWAATLPPQWFYFKPSRWLPARLCKLSALAA